ncbi:MAG: murein biosynthesis integral membrane protein MurJ [Proteobacteria bacterium]|nr:murein biosynthesis integral membrane protein MurJ [Pseudomonadota bacterium]
MNVLKAASTVSLWTLLSRVTGLVRDQLIAYGFGANAMTDAFNVAFRIPNLLRRLFAEGAFSAAFVPILATTREREGDAATHELIDAVATVLVWVLIATCIVGVLAAPLLAWAMGAGLARLDLAVVMTRWMFPYIFFMSLVALASGVLNTWRRFAVPAATPVLLNVAMIAATLWLAPWLGRHGIEPIHALSAGVLLGGVLQLGVQISALARLGVLPRVRVSPRGVARAWRHPGVGKMLGLMAPAILGVSVAQISLLINTQIASHLGEGAPSYLFYADRLMEFPTALLGVALGVVLVPGLSARLAAGDRAGYSAQLDWGLRLMALLALPCSVALLVFGLPLVATLFHHGKFGDEAAQMTTLALRSYGVGLFGLIAIKVLLPGFLAQQDLRTPVRIAIVVLVCTQLMNLVFVPWLGHAGLALSIAVAALLNAGWLYVGLRRRQMYQPAPGWAWFLARIALASAMLGWALWEATRRIDWLALRAHEGQRVAWLAAVVVAAVLGYFALLTLMGINLRHFARKAPTLGA